MTLAYDYNHDDDHAHGHGHDHDHDGGDIGNGGDGGDGGDGGGGGGDGGCVGLWVCFCGSGGDHSLIPSKSFIQPHFKHIWYILMHFCSSLTKFGQLYFCLLNLAVQSFGLTFLCVSVRS